MENVKLNVSHHHEELGIDEAVVVFNDINDGFIFSIIDVYFRHNEVKAVISDILEIYPDLKLYDYSRNNNKIFKKYENNDIRIYIRGNSIDLYGSFYCKSEEINHYLWEIYKNNTEEESDVEVFMYNYAMNNGSISETLKSFKIKETDYISEKYYPYIDIDVMFEQFFTGSENILLLVGEPGLGKSKMATLALKYAYNNVDKLPYDKIEENPVLENQYISAVSVKSIEVLANDNFWKALEKSKPDFCIIDDLDYMLTKRDSEVTSSDDAIKNSFLNQFLSFTDGVEKNNTKFIITTNQKYTDIDTALLRKGRLFDILELRKLDKREALDVWLENGLKEEEFHEIFTDHQILSADLGSEISKKINTRITSNNKHYIKEDGISKVDKAGRSKKIGL